MIERPSRTLGLAAMKADIWQEQHILMVVMGKFGVRDGRCSS